ncbi:hypothetical protein M5D96_000693 [Drosophila gunungcola]|uniref:Uncharacterized protein n=1 Tax=Drosophila gunungcola TaxID=103775 RepID=A0A9Q0BUQ5_9MUSC|nr:hypothetical protein M5D96_000693 [Drosophila gunungcola]
MFSKRGSLDISLEDLFTSGEGRSISFSSCFFSIMSFSPKEKDIGAGISSRKSSLGLGTIGGVSGIFWINLGSVLFCTIGTSFLFSSQMSGIFS